MYPTLLTCMVQVDVAVDKSLPNLLIEIKDNVSKYIKLISNLFASYMEAFQTLWDRGCEIKT